MNDLAFRCEKIETTIDKVTDPRNWPFRRDSRRVRDAAIQAAKYQDPSTILVPVTIGFAKTLSAVAADLGVTIETLLATNPVLARNPFVKKGTIVRVPRA
jgi:LysM repeat protein